MGVVGHSHAHGSRVGQPGEHADGHASSRATDRRRLRLVLVIAIVVVVVELVGAWLAGSLALLADAGHVAADGAAVALALTASYVATTRPTSRWTFGLHRAEVLAAMVNAVVLLGVCGYLFYAGIGRLRDPEPVDALPLITFALVGMVANGVALAILSRGDTDALHLRSALLEVAADLVGSALVVVAGIVIATTGFDRADPIASLVIAGLVLPRAFALIRDSGAVLLEATPVGLDLDAVRVGLLGIEGVVEVHDLHAWTITSGMPSLSVHVTVTDGRLAACGVGGVLDQLSEYVATDHGVRHATFQIEPASHRDHEDLGEPHCD